MGTQLTVGHFTSTGDFVDLDLRALRRAATPRWRARDGEGKGVSADDLRQILKDLLIRLSWSGGSDVQYDLQFVLGLVERLLRQQEEHRLGAEIALERIRREIEGIADPKIAAEFEVLAACVSPIERVWSGS